MVVNSVHVSALNKVETERVDQTETQLYVWNGHLCKVKGF